MPVDESTTTKLFNHLGDPERSVRNSAIERLSGVEAGDAVPLALKALYDQNNTGKRNAAMEVLRRFELQIVPYLADHIQSTDPDVRMFLLTLIGELRDRTYLRFVLSMLSDPEENIVSAAIMAIGRIGDPSLAPHLLDFLQGSNLWLQFQAVEAAGEMHDASLLPHLLPLLDSAFCRKAAIKALGRFQHASAYQALSSILIRNHRCDYDALHSLIQLYHTAHPAERSRLQDICCITVDPDCTATMLDIMKNGSRAEQFNIAQVLAWCGNSEALQHLRNFEQDPAFADQTIRTLLSMEALDAFTIPFPMNDFVYGRITDLIYGHSGLRFDHSSRYMISRRLYRRLPELHLHSFEEYVAYLIDSPDRNAEMDRVFDIVTTHETYFFREENQLQAFSEEIVPELMEKRTEFRSLRIWSAGCSSGEEPYTIAILCRENPKLSGWNIDILATDISRHMVQKARCGIYREPAFRSTSELLKTKYFHPQENGSYRINDEIRQLVRFMKLNLIDEDTTGMLGEVDVIFCRNVLIYLDLDARKRVIETLFRKLRKGGYLLLGHSESLMNLPTHFKLRHLKNDLVYQK